jgi:hypothetical protein
MKAILKDLISPDIDFDTYWPEDENDFGFLLEATIGPDDADGGHDYQIFVCSPMWLLKRHQKDDLVWGRHLLIAFEYDMPRIRRKIEEYCSQCTGKDWMEIAAKVARIGQWEFEDYTDYEPHTEPSTGQRRHK